MPSGPASRPPNWPLFYLSVALTSCASLLLALALYRIFSVVFARGFAFPAIAIALLGIGAGGVLSCLATSWSGPVYRKLGLVSLATSGFVLPAVFLVLSRTVAMSASLGIVSAIAAVPFIGAGFILSLVISENAERVGTVCFHALLGAAAGCILLVALLNAFGGPNTVIAVAILFVAAAAVWFSLAGARLFRVVSVFAGLLLTMLVIANTGVRFFDVRYAKGASLPPELFVKWNTLARIGLSRAPNGGAAISIDGASPGPIAGLDSARLAAKILILGAGGGIDVARALAAGSRDVTVVETNPVIANTIMRQKFAAMSHGLYLRPEVHVYIDDGRNFIRRTQEKFQVIQVNAAIDRSLDSPDALGDCLKRLTDDGTVLVSRNEGLTVADEAVPVRFEPKQFVVLSAAALFVLLVLFLPRLVRGARVRATPSYFLLTGAGFTMLGTALIQSFVRFLGHPGYAMTVVTFSLLASAGAGSLRSRAILQDREGSLRMVLLAIAAVACMFTLVLPPIFSVGMPLTTRMLASFVLLSPAGFAMGVALPSGLRQCGDTSRLRWAWSLVAVAGVAGSAAALAMTNDVALYIAAVLIAMPAFRSWVAASAH